MKNGRIFTSEISSRLQVNNPLSTIVSKVYHSRSPHPSRSPHLPPGSRSPMMTDPSNPLKVSIALGQKPAIIQKGPYYLMKTEPIMMSEVTGATNLMASKNLEHSFQKLAGELSQCLEFVVIILFQPRRWRTACLVFCPGCQAWWTPQLSRTTPVSDNSLRSRLWEERSWFFSTNYN